MNAGEDTKALVRITSFGRKRPSRRSQASALTKEEWIQEYTGRVLRSWFHQPAALGLAWTYANWIRRDLAECYAQPLRRAFIEETY